MKIKIEGYLTALITPMKHDKTIDYASFEKIINFQIEEGISGLVPVGTTGESSTLSLEEHSMVVEKCVKLSASKVPVIAGAGSNSTSDSVLLARHAEKAGADGVLVVSPYYNKPSQEGLFNHFVEVASSVSIPIILYNIPSRSVVSIDIDTISRMVERCPNIIGIKDAESDNIDRFTATRNALGKKFIQLSGDDATAAASFALGGVGCISVASNVIPGLLQKLYKCYIQKDYDECDKIICQTYDFNKNIFKEPSPSPIKYAASLKDLCEPFVRSPLVEVSDDLKKIIKKNLVAFS